jgi:uncharacterized DUF497 family protein
MLFNFEWDPYKAKLNVQKHGVAFEHAAEVFQDSMAISVFDDEHSQNEDRWITLGKSYSGNTLVVIHTFQEDAADACKIRIISARKATRKESNQYESFK